MKNVFQKFQLVDWKQVGITVIIGLFFGLFGSDGPWEGTTDWLLVFMGMAGFLFGQFSLPKTFMFSKEAERSPLYRTAWERNRSRRLGPAVWFVLTIISVVFMRIGAGGTLTGWSVWLVIPYAVSWWFVHNISKRLWTWDVVPTNTLMMRGAVLYGPGTRYRNRAWERVWRDFFTGRMVELDPIALTMWRDDHEAEPRRVVLETSVCIDEVPRGEIPFDLAEFKRLASERIQAYTEGSLSDNAGGFEQLFVPFPDEMLDVDEWPGLVARWPGYGSWTITTKQAGVGAGTNPTN